MLLDPRNHVSSDLPPPPVAPRAYAIASTPRTGSTLLCRLLWSTGAVGAPKEYLNPTQIRDWQVRRGRWWFRALRGPSRALLRRRPWSDRALAAHLLDVRHHRSSGGWFGLKIHHHHHGRIFRRRALSDILGPIRWIHISRDDQLGQAISWARALQTGQWAADERAFLRPLYSRRLISSCLDEIQRGEAYWAGFFSSNGLHPLHVEYAALVADPGKEVGGVLTALGVAGSVGAVSLRAASLRAQADAVSDDWRGRFTRWQRSAGSDRGGSPARSR